MQQQQRCSREILFWQRPMDTSAVAEIKWQWRRRQLPHPRLNRSRGDQDVLVCRAVIVGKKKGGNKKKTKRDHKHLFTHAQCGWGKKNMENFSFFQSSIFFFCVFDFTFLLLISLFQTSRMYSASGFLGACSCSSRSVRLLRGFLDLLNEEWWNQNLIF